MKELVLGQFNDSFPPIMDGVGNVVKNYSYWLNQKYGECYTITPSFPEYEDEEDFQVLRYFSVGMPVRKPYRLGLYNVDLDFLKRLNDIPFDLIHAHCPFSSGKLALRLGKTKNIPVIATFHSKYYDDFKQVVKSNSLAKLLTRHVVKFYESVDYVWTVNEASKETLRSYGFKGNIDVMENGIDLKPPKDPEKLIDCINKSLGIKDELVFLFVGQHIWQKNIRLIIEALRILSERGLDFKMLFVGEGPAKADMIRMIEEYNLSDKVKFLGVIKEREYLMGLYTRADLFLFPSLYDTSGIVVKEAAICNCPSVLIKGANATDGVIDNFNGFLSENEPLAYANKLMEIAKDKENILRVGKNAAGTLATKWEEIVDKVYDRYREIIRGDNFD